VGANNGLIVDSSTGVSIVQLGALASGVNSINGVARFVSQSGIGAALNFDGDGAMNIGGATGNMALNINTGASQMTLQSTVLDNVANANNFVWVDTVNNQVHRARTSALGRDNAALDFVAIDHVTGNIVRAISPTAGISRGQIAGTGVFQYTSPAIPSILAGASITCTIENHSGVLGAVLVQVTAITTGVNGTFQVETSDDIPAGSFINYVVMNP